MSRTPFTLFVVLAAGCTGANANKPQAMDISGPQSVAAEVVIPAELSRTPLARTVVAKGLNNPRGLHLLQDGALLVSEAGIGLPNDPGSGRLLRLEDRNRDGDYLDAGEQHVVLDHQPSKNLIGIVRRDEVFGMAGIDEGDATLVALAFFGGPSTIFQIDGDSVVQWGSTHTNVNDLAYDPGRKQWFAVASTTDEVVRLMPGGGTERIVKFPPLPSGQDAVPAAIQHDPTTGELLVTLFSGSPEGEEGGTGLEIQPRAGGIVAINPDTRAYRWVVSGLTVPTDLGIAPDGSIYVLEFCDEFLDPAQTTDELLKKPSHGGFKRFSGRLLRVTRRAASTTIVAERLDTPTNLTIAAGSVYVSEGMGTPGREIPTPSGIAKLEGFVERIALAP
jgi:glucose/arabinose dehydrogenase